MIFIYKNNPIKTPVFSYAYPAYYRFTLNTTVSTPGSALVQVKHEETVIFLNNWAEEYHRPTVVLPLITLNLHQFCKNAHREKRETGQHTGQLKVYSASICPSGYVGLRRQGSRVTHAGLVGRSAVPESREER